MLSFSLSGFFYCYGSQVEGEHFPDCEEKDFKVEPQRVVVDIVDVGLHAAAHVVDIGKTLPDV